MATPGKDKEKTSAQIAEEAQALKDTKLGMIAKWQNKIKETISSFSQERVSTTHGHFYHYPLDLAGGVKETGAPFIRFTIKPHDDPNRVVIFLYQPPGFSVADGANYANFDIGSIKGGIGLMQSLGKGGGSGLTRADLGAFAMMGKDKLLTGSDTIDKITSGGAISAGIATNPYTRTAYESTNVRTFSFSFKLVAESKEESIQAKNIERTFRKFLYPKRAGAIALVYPPLFNIEFYSNGEPNKYMPKIRPCYLTSLESTFNESTTAMHADTGAPVEVNITVGFQEERVLVRQDLYPNDDAIDEKPSGYYNPKGSALAGDSSGKAETKTSPAGSGFNAFDGFTGGKE